MADSSASQTLRTFSGLGRRIDAFIVSIAVLAITATALVAYFEFSHGLSVEEPILFALVAGVLVVTECRSTTVLQHTTGGVVTPSWAFSFTLMLLGSPTGAIAVMAVATVLADLLSGRPAFKIVFNATQIALSLALGGLVLFACGIRGPLFAEVTLSTDRAIAMILSGSVVFLSNGVIICRLLAWLEEARFLEMMRGTFLLSMTSDAAMLAIAPIFLVTAKNNLVMLPLMGTATYFVYQTAQNALRRTHEANHDPLTQLLNRRAFNTVVDEALSLGASEGTVHSMLLLDLDRFKEVNDRLGHRTGDHVLQQFATRLLGAVPDGSQVARLGGDEFSVMLTSPDTAASDATVARLHHELSAPLTVDGFPITAGASIGVAHAGVHGWTTSELMHAADVAMYRAKSYGTGVETYESFGSSLSRGRVTLLADVAEGLEHGQFLLEYQPQVSIDGKEIVAVEALLRWEHPEHGRIGPGEFVALAEHTDLIGPVTEFVIDTAVAEIGALDADVTLAVNVSARNLEDRHFASELLARLASADFCPSRLEVEITESALGAHPERTIVVLQELRAAGIRIAIDDFGTGYSSFGTLRDHTVDRIKIDRSFTERINRSDADVQIIRSVIDLAHGLGLDVVAEGVETTEVLDRLDELGCDVAQGFLLSRPIPLDRVAELLECGFSAPVPDHMIASLR